MNITTPRIALTLSAAALALAACQPSTPAPAASTAEAPTAASAQAPAVAAAPAAESQASAVERYNKDEAEMIDNTSTMLYAAKNGDKLSVRFYQKNEPGIDTPNDYAEVQFGSGPKIDMSKATEENGNPVFGGGTPGITMIVQESGGRVTIVREGGKREVYEATGTQQ